MDTEQDIKNLKLKGKIMSRYFLPIGLQEWTIKKMTMTKKNDEYVNKEKDYKYDNELEDERAYNRINQEEIEVLFAEPSDVNNNNNSNPTNNDDALAFDGNNDREKVPDERTSARPTRT